MSLVSAWRERSSEASRSELEQCVLRVLIGGLVFLWVFFSRRVPSWTETDAVLVWSSAAWLLVAIGFLVAIWTWPAPSISRRTLGIILDVGTITAALYFLDARGSVIIFTYLFIIFGNGFRYGRSYLFLSQCVSLVGLLFVATNVSWWKSHPDVSIGWFIGLIVLPIYVGMLVERLKTARAKAEEALKECIERQPRLS